jgi:hypothetical protein
LGKYIKKDLVFTNELIDKYIIVHGIRGEDAVEQCIEELNCLLQAMTDYLRKMIDDQIEKAINELPDNSRYFIQGKLVIPKNIFPQPLFHDYLIKQFNNFFKNELNEFSDFKAFNQATEFEERAFIVNLNSLIIEHHHKRVKTHTQPALILQQYNEQLYDIINNKSLLKKLKKRQKNAYLKHLTNSIQYLEIRSLANNPKQNALIIDASEIVKLKKFDGLLWESGLQEEEFISFWRLGKKSTYLPIKKGMISPFLFLLFAYYKPIGTYSDLEMAFNLTDIKGKKSKINLNTPSCKKIKLLNGQPKYALKPLKR